MGIEGTFRDTAFALVRFSGFTANALLFGLPVVLLLVFQPGAARLDSTWDRGRARFSQRLEGLLQSALVASGMATLLGLLLQALLVADINKGDLKETSFLSVLGTNFGQWYALRIPLLIGLAVLTVGRVRRWALPAGGSGGAGRGWWWGWIGISLALLATSSLTGHAFVGDPKALSLLNDFLHLASGATWFTGIIVLAIALPDMWVGKDKDERIRVLSPVVTKFSHVALIAISIVAITGTINALFDVEHLGDLTSSGYGITLALKIALFVTVLGLGAINHFVLRVRMQAAEKDGKPTDAQNMFRRTIAVELAIAIGLMGLTGVLTGLAKTRSGSSSSVEAPVSSRS